MSTWHSKKKPSKTKEWLVVFSIYCLYFAHPRSLYQVYLARRSS